MRSPAARPVLPAVVAILALLAFVAVAPAPAAAQEVENGTTTFDFDLRTNGDARVSVTLRLGLSDETDRGGFDRLAEEHTSGTESPLSAEPFEQAAARASEATGRSMEIQGVSWTASRTEDVGQLSLSFTWTNFTSSAGDRLFVGDAFQTPEGTWLPGLDENQELVISFPPGYSPQSISMPGTRYQLVNGTVRVEGPTALEPGTPSLVLQHTATPSGPPWELIAGAAVAIAILAVPAFLYRDRLPTLGQDADADEGTIEEEPEADDELDPMEEPLLSDDERVLKLLESRNGRMKQVEIVEATDWSNAKVSQLLSDMESQGRIDKLRIGRENLISLPGQGPGGE